MATVTGHALTAGFNTATASQAMASIILPENALVFADVETYHTTSGSLATPTLSGTGGETWVQVATRTVGGGSPLRRLTRFRTMVAADATTVVTIACGGVAQTGLAWSVTCYGGVTTGGTNGADAVGQVVSGDSGTSSVTTLSLALAAFGSLTNGVSAAFVNGTASGITPRSGWTELSDTAITSTSNRLEVQFAAVNDTQANCTASSGLLMGIACEIVAAPGLGRRVTSTTLWNAAATSDPQVIVGVNLRPGSTWFLQVAGNSASSHVPTSAGVTWTLKQSTSFYNGVFNAIYSTTVALDVTVNISVDNAGVGVGLEIALIEVANVDTAVGAGTGLIQSKQWASATNIATIWSETFAATVDPQSITVILAGTNNTSAGCFAARPGWQQAHQLGGGFGCIAGFWRANGDQDPDVQRMDVASTYSAMAFEFAAGSASVAGDAPVIALVSPAEGPITASAPIVIDVTDPDGDLTTVIPMFDMPTSGISEIAHNGTVFAAAYLAGSTRTAITNGFRYTFNRVGGWVTVPLTLTVLAFDAEGNQTSDLFTWLTDYVAPTGADGIGIPKLEARIRIPVGGWAVETVDANGTVTRTVPAGDYYLSSPAPGGIRSLTAQLAVTLSAGSMVYTVTVDDDLDLSTGRVTIAANAGFTLNWPNLILRNILGFTAAIAGSSVQSPNHARYLWLPNLRRFPSTPEPILGEASQDFGRPSADYILTMSPSGATTQSVFSRRRHDRLVFEPLLGSKCWLSNEAIVNESFERFWLDVMADGGVPWRYHSSRANDLLYWTQVFDQDAAELTAAPTVAGWVGPLSLWHLEFGCRKYWPLLVAGVYE